MPRTKLQGLTPDPLEKFRSILKKKMRENHIQSKTIAEWMGITQKSMSMKMTGKERFSFEQMRFLAYKMDFSSHDKLEVFK